MQATLAIHSRDRIGEGPCWDASSQRILWSDNEIGIVHEARADAKGGWLESRRWSLGRGLAAAIPRAGGGLAILSGTNILFMDERDGSCTPFAELPADPGRIRINDAKCDPRGRLWATTLALDFSTSAGLYRIGPDGTVTPMLDHIRLGNGLDWSRDGRTFYFIDSLSRSVDAFDFDPADGTLANRRTLLTLEQGGPNGMCVDLEGCLWVAATGTGEVQRFTPAGVLIQRVTIATPGATSCAFGGADGRSLFITSLGRRMPDVALELGLTPDRLENDRPQSGALFVCRPGVAGAPATAFAG
jgi:sugar lactone lactonase YvrE